MIKRLAEYAADKGYKEPAMILHQQYERAEEQKQALRQLGGVNGKPQHIEKGFFDRFKQVIGFD